MKYTPGLVKELKEMYDDGLTYSSISYYTGISKGHVRYLLSLRARQNQKKVMKKYLLSLSSDNLEKIYKKNEEIAKREKYVLRYYWRKKIKERIEKGLPPYNEK